MRIETILVYTYGLFLLVGFWLSIKQMKLIRQLGEKRPKGFEIYKFLWPLWAKQTLKNQHASSLSDEETIDRLVKLRTINTIIFLPFIVFWIAVLILVIFTL
jgi:hypothetical protein